MLIFHYGKYHPANQPTEYGDFYALNIFIDHFDNGGAPYLSLGVVYDANYVISKKN